MLKSFAAMLLVLSLILPLSANASTQEFTISTPKGPIGTSVVINGTLLGGQWANKNVKIVVLFVNSTISPRLLQAGAGAVVASATTSSSGQFATSFFVPLVPKGNYNLTIRTESAPYNFSQSPQTFLVTFGTDDLARISSTILTINASLVTLGAKLRSVPDITSALQVQLSGLKSNLTQIQDLVRSVSSELNNPQSPIFSSLNTEINNISQSISNLNKRFAELNATLVAGKADSSRQEQLNLLSIIATIGVGAVLLVVIQFGSRRKKRAGIDDWDVFD